MVGDHELDGGFRATVWICGADWAVLWDGDHAGMLGGVAVDGCGGGEDDVGDVVRCHGAEEGDGTTDINAVVFERDFGGLANCLVSVLIFGLVEERVFREE